MDFVRIHGFARLSPWYRNVKLSWKIKIYPTSNKIHSCRPYNSHTMDFRGESDVCGLTLSLGHTEQAENFQRESLIAIFHRGHSPPYIFQLARCGYRLSVMGGFSGGVNPLNFS